MRLFLLPGHLRQQALTGKTAEMKTAKNAANGGLKLSRLLLTAICTGVISLAVQGACFAASVAIQWDPNTEADLAGYNVYYKADSPALPFNGTGAVEGVSPVNVHSQTSAIISGLNPGHTYYFAVTAYNASGLESAYSNIVSIPESVLPTISLSAPANNSVVSGTVSISATAADNVGVVNVELYVNGSLQAADSAFPYVFSWDTAPLAVGTYTVVARAYDAAGNVGQSATLTLMVIKDTTPPTVSLTGPTKNATANGTVTVSAIASDNVGVSMVEFYDNGLLMAAMNVAPYSYSWNTQMVGNGSHALSARAYDTSGNMGQSGSVSVTVANVAAGGLVKLTDNGQVSYYQNLSSAYNAIANGTNVVISVQTGTFTESLNFNRNIPVKVVGGYDASFTTHFGMTTVKGSLALGAGSESIEGLCLL